MARETVEKEEWAYLERQTIEVNILTKLTSLVTKMVTQYEFKVKISRLLIIEIERPKEILEIELTQG